MYRFLKFLAENYNCTIYICVCIYTCMCVCIQNAVYQNLMVTANKEKPIIYIFRQKRKMNPNTTAKIAIKS